ncbi:putative baseplate assembly protein [Edaphobacter sp. HDX4]|uniref:putative baseplate assembly protein n=1 Tax=Edaphobacter sp. HDX4 TaxID=2794064 RepID=UPI002FE53F8C
MNCGGGGLGLPASDNTANRAGLSTIVYRVGTHSTFFETMKARLSNLALELPVQDRCLVLRNSFPLSGLGTRENDDFSIALLDAWATVADVLTFYQERIANEGYLRTATEPFSIFELARLTGYRPRPGVASSVYLAYTLEKDHAVDILAGSRSQSSPGPGEFPQSFETSKNLSSREIWNNLKPRQTQPQSPTKTGKVVYLKGISTNLKLNDRLLFTFAGSDPVPRRIFAVEPDNDRNWTKVSLEPVSASTDRGTKKDLMQTVQSLMGMSAKAPATHPVDSMRLGREASAVTLDSEVVLQIAAVVRPQLDSQHLMEAVRNANVSLSQPAEVYAFRVRASLFGHNAPKKLVFGSNNQVLDPVEWPLTRTVPTAGSQQRFTFSARLDGHSDNLTLHTEIQIGEARPIVNDRDLKAGTFDLGSGIALTAKDRPELNPPFQLDYTFKGSPLQITIIPVASQRAHHGASVVGAGTDPTTISVDLNSDGIPTYTVEGQMSASTVQPTEEPDRISLDNLYEKIVPQGWILLEHEQEDGVSSIVSPIVTTVERSRADYGISGKVTEITLEKNKLNFNRKKVPDLSIVRGFAVFAQSERLELSEAPIEKPVARDKIELDDFYDGLEAGHWLIVAGERVDLKGVQGAELVMLAGAEHAANPDVPGDRIHTSLLLAGGLSYTYKRDTVQIFGNVVHATHGETRSEVLGSGNASQALQQFQLKQSPLTYISAPTATGVESTLEVRVNGMLWHEATDLAALGPRDHSLFLRTGNDSKTTVVFGNGIQGARVPTGIENIKAVYRTGLGSSGNVDAGSIKMVTTKPLGVKDVINPIRASGGADPESGDSTRRNAPLTVMSLDRLVSVQDYADFARTFAGIGKANATQIDTTVQVTIAGVDNISIDETSDLFVNLLAAFEKLGDPQQRIQLAVFKPLLLVIQASVAILPDYEFTVVASNIKSELLSRFSFNNRDLGQNILESEIVSAMQNIEGVMYVDLDVLDIVSEDLSSLSRQLSIPTPGTAEPGSMSIKVLPWQIAFLAPQIPRTLILLEASNV